VKLPCCRPPNFIIIQLHRSGLFFVGLKNLAGQVWDWIVAQVETPHRILNAYIHDRVGI